MDQLLKERDEYRQPTIMVETQRRSTLYKGPQEPELGRRSVQPERVNSNVRQRVSLVKRKTRDPQDIINEVVKEDNFAEVDDSRETKIINYNEDEFAIKKASPETLE